MSSSKDGPGCKLWLGSSILTCIYLGYLAIPVVIENSVPEFGFLRLQIYLKSLLRYKYKSIRCTSYRLKQEKGRYPAIIGKTPFRRGQSAGASGTSPLASQGSSLPRMLMARSILICFSRPPISSTISSFFDFTLHLRRLPCQCISLVACPSMRITA